MILFSAHWLIRKLMLLIVWKIVTQRKKSFPQFIKSRQTGKKFATTVLIASIKAPAFAGAFFILIFN